MNKLITVAIIDSGIYPHIDFKNRILSFKDFVAEKRFPYDDCGHGTHVSGIIAGDGTASHGRIKGICPYAGIISLKVLDKHGNGKIEDVINAADWILKHRTEFNIKVVNISFGTTTYGEQKDSASLEQAIERLWDSGISVVAAAGNDGPRNCSVAIPGTCKKIITVGSPDGKDFYSGRGPTPKCIVKPELIVNGSYIKSCSNKGNSYSIKSGTSMSAPIVSGAIARILSKADYSPKEIKILLKKCCTKKALPDNLQGWGILNIPEFLNYNKPLTITAD